MNPSPATGGPLFSLSKTARRSASESPHYSVYLTTLSLGLSESLLHTINSTVKPGMNASAAHCKLVASLTTPSDRTNGRLASH